MESFEEIAKDLDRMAETLDCVEDAQHWTDTPADIAEIYRTYARRIRNAAKAKESKSEDNKSC